MVHGSGLGFRALGPLTKNDYERELLGFAIMNCCARLSGLSALQQLTLAVACMPNDPSRTIPGACIQQTGPSGMKTFPAAAHNPTGKH